MPGWSSASGVSVVCVLVQEVFFAPVWIPAPLMSSVCPGPTVNLFLPTIDSPEDMDHISSSRSAQRGVWYTVVLINYLVMWISEHVLACVLNFVAS